VAALPGRVSIDSQVANIELRIEEMQMSKIKKDLVLFYDTIRIEQQRLQWRPHLLFQQLYNTLQWNADPTVRAAAERGLVGFLNTGRRFLHQYRKPEIEIGFESMRFTAEQGSIASCAWSPDGKMFISGGREPFAPEGTVGGLG
jgi:hypothetical protein